MTTNHVLCCITACYYRNLDSCLSCGLTEKSLINMADYFYTRGLMTFERKTDANYLTCICPVLSMINILDENANCSCRCVNINYMSDLYNIIVNIILIEFAMKFGDGKTNLEYIRPKLTKSLEHDKYFVKRECWITQLCQNNDIDTIWNLINVLLEPSKASVNFMVSTTWIRDFLPLHHRSLVNLYRINFGWSVPNMAVLEKIRDFVGSDKLLEIAAGIGFWAWLLRQIGVNVRPTSIFNKEYHGGGFTYSEMRMNPMFDSDVVTWLPVENISAVEAVKKYRDHNCLMIVWGKNTLDDALEHFKGDKLIVVGEDIGGCTDALSEKWLRKFQQQDIPGNITQIRFSQYMKCNDYVNFYTRII